MVDDTAGVPLLDANVLIALLWPHHRHHATAHRWFSEKTEQRWASCAITQSAFVRISMNERIHGVKVDYGTVLDKLAALVRRPDHVFWDRLPAIGELPMLRQLLIQGYRQLTDAYLLALARHNGSRLVTFDAGIPTLLPLAADRKRWVELIVP